MKTPTDPKEELLQQLATSLLRDVFAAAVAAGVYANPDDKPADSLLAKGAYEVADALLELSHTPALIEQLSKLKQ